MFTEKFPIVENKEHLIEFVFSFLFQAKIIWDKKITKSRSYDQRQKLRADLSMHAKKKT